MLDSATEHDRESTLPDQLITQIPPGRSPVSPERRIDRTTTPAEHLARRELRGQIAKLERELGRAFVSAFPHPGPDLSVPASGGPRLLGLGELELLRDGLSARLAEARDQIARRGEAQERNRVLLERMLLEPGRYKFVRIANADLGDGGCGHWHVRPRFGLIGMLAGWWQVKLSSGCPLAGGRRRSAPPRLSATDLSPLPALGAPA